MEVIVAGAGIVGVSCAIWLQRAGHTVTLVDRSGPASGTSHGNAGILAAGSVVPVTVPGLASKAPGMLLDRNAPLFLRWSYLPKLLPFLRKYLSYGTDAHVRYFAQHMFYLLGDTLAQHQALSRDTPAARFVHADDWCYGYATQKDFEADGYGWSKRKEAGVPYEVVSGKEYARFDPFWGDAFDVVVRLKNHGRISDPGAYVSALADHFVSEGGKLHITTIEDIVVVEGTIQALQTADGDLRADHIVMAMGPWSGRIARKLGVKVPFESERGYHVEFVNPSAYPKLPVMVASGKFVITPMEGRIRAAGVVEFGGLKAGPSRAPLELIKRQVAAAVPDLVYEDIVEWMGHRPAPADSLPLIGATNATRKSHLAFGHQHVGLTGGPKTGRIIADMISGARPNADLSPFDPKKYVAQRRQ